ncbi:unnamed protein product [Effrenium voratum]|uniref:ABC1 atypical kinase-like domain-containing protein n=1 Tax=Effrenium voratum TaxID=2562239 RepID=A0AA36IH13_9DINO|nr:unnamed protein product [Effrenium voratum]
MDLQVPCLSGVDYVATERKKMAEDVVKFAVDIYVHGCLTKPVYYLSEWVPLVAQMCPQATLSDSQRHDLIARVLFESATKFGGLAFKALQYVSLRTDIPSGYRRHFCKALEEASFISDPDDIKQALSSVDSSLGDLSVGEVLKSGSMASVHEAWLDGKPAVCKLLHQKVCQTYKDDLDIMVHIAKEVNKEELARGIYPLLSGLAEKLETVLSGETDMRKEAKNQGFVRQHFAGSSIVVPEVYESTEQVLLMEKLDGITGYEAEQKWAEGKVVDVFGQDQRVLLYSAWGAMLAGETLVHADAHPGNFMAWERGAVALLDFGQCFASSDAQVKKFMRFLGNFPSCADPNQDVKILESLRNLGVEVETSKAVTAARILFLGMEGKMFADIGSIDPEVVGLVLICQALSRFEVSASGGRQKVGLSDKCDHHRVLKTFKQVAKVEGLCCKFTWGSLQGQGTVTFTPDCLMLEFPGPRTNEATKGRSETQVVEVPLGRVENASAAVSGGFPLHLSVTSEQSEQFGPTILKINYLEGEKAKSEEILRFLGELFPGGSDA